MTANTLIYALLGGILPALIWLLFWLREDKAHPEPNREIMKTFLLGMLAVPLVIPLQKGVELFFPGVTLLTLLLWAVFEEVFKFLAGYFGGIHTVEDNEPLDPIIYMITAALGFVALENTLFILGPLLDEEIISGVITGNMRFIGASLLHVVCSGLVGSALAFAFYRKRAEKKLRVALALVGAIVFHTLFNFIIVNFGSTGTMAAFFLVWASIVALLLTFERAKSIAPPSF